MNCPECKKNLPDVATACRCGWTKSSSPQSMTLGYQQCEWQAWGEQCRFPGSMTTNTHEGGPYFCRAHFACDDPAFGAQVVEQSRDYKHPTEQEINAAHVKRAKEALKLIGLDRRADESFEAWRKRMVVFIKQAKIVKRAA